MSTLPTTLAQLSKHSTEAQIIKAIQSVLASCNGIESVSRFGIMEDGKSRNFLIDTNSASNVEKIIDLLGGRSKYCKSFSTASVLVTIAD